MHHFELWDMETANKIGSAPTRDAALALVRDFLATGDPHYETNVSMGWTDADGEIHPVASGITLVRLAHQTATTLESVNIEHVEGLSTAAGGSA